jgi:hypothetical protein
MLQGEGLIAECARILKPGGILRIAVPDLERIARLYLEKLEDAAKGKQGAHADYEWMLLELLDQTVRERAGGEMETYLSRKQIENIDFVLSRIGTEGKGLIAKAEPGNRFSQKNRFLKRLASKSPQQILAKIRAEGFRGLSWRVRTAISSIFVFLISGRAGLSAFRSGLFRSGGEIHQWMYDRYSLTRLLEKFGFQDIRICRHDESRIPDYSRYGLDSVEGNARKPDSLYIEAVKKGAMK